MDAGTLFELLVAFAIIAAGLLGSRKKKKQQQTPDEQRQQAARRERERQQARTPQADPEPARDELFSEIERMLRGELGQPEPERAPAPPQVPDPDEAVSLEPLEPDPRSLERLEIDPVARHKAFHDQYLPATPTRPAVEAAWGTRPTTGQGVRLARMNLRQAVIWREVLGPPRGLEP